MRLSADGRRISLIAVAGRQRFSSKQLLGQALQQRRERGPASHNASIETTSARHAASASSWIAIIHCSRCIQATTPQIMLRMHNSILLTIF